MVLYGSPHLSEISLVIEDGFAASARLGFEADDALSLIAFDPAIDAHHAEADLGSDLPGRQAVGFEQDHTAAGAKGMAWAVAEAFF